MKRKHVFRSRWCVMSALVVLALPSGVAAQANRESGSKERIVEILNADSARAARVDGMAADMLIGNVALRQGETLLNADRAVRFKTNDQIIFDGSVTIIDEGDSLAADRVVYESDVKTGVGTGNVRWSDGEVEITATLARYFLNEKIAEFEGDVVMQDSTTTVLSLVGDYDVNTRVASFRDDIYLEQRRLALTAAILRHERESGMTAASGGVWINRIPEDPDEQNTRIVLVADSASSERDSALNHLVGRAGIVRIETNENESDTLVVRAGSVIAEFADSTDTFDAAGGVRFLRGSLAGRADSLHYTSLSDSVSRHSSTRMLGDPFVWSADAQVNGDTVNVVVDEGHPRLLEAYENAFVGFEDTTNDFIQQLKGQRLMAYFEADSLRRLVMEPNAEALYFAVDSTSDDELSAMRFTSRRITLEFASGDIRRITAANDVEGDLKELDRGAPLPALQAFRWRVSDRPRRNDLIDANVTSALTRFEPF